MLTHIRLRHPLADDVLSSYTAYKEMTMPKLGAVEFTRVTRTKLQILTQKLLLVASLQGAINEAARLRMLTYADVC